MSSTPTAAREEVYALLEPLATTGVTVQLAVKLPLPKPVTIALSPAGQNPTEFLVRVSVYADASSDPVGAQEKVETWSDAAEAALADCPRSDWATSYTTDLESWTAQTVVSVPREDF